MRQKMGSDQGIGGEGDQGHSPGFRNRNQPNLAKMFVADSDQASIDRYVADERQRVMDELAAFHLAIDFAASEARNIASAVMFLGSPSLERSDGH